MLLETASIIRPVHTFKQGEKTLPIKTTIDLGLKKRAHMLRNENSSIPQIMAQNFFLQIIKGLRIFSSFSNKYDLTSHRNFGAMSLTFDRIDSSSLMITNPCRFKILIKVKHSLTHHALDE